MPNLRNSVMRGPAAVPRAIPSCFLFCPAPGAPHLRGGGCLEERYRVWIPGPGMAGWEQRDNRFKTNLNFKPNGNTAIPITQTPQLSAIARKDPGRPHFTFFRPGCLHATATRESKPKGEKIGASLCKTYMRTVENSKHPERGIGDEIVRTTLIIFEF